jgi:dolichol-phosphate mannosyltransferase
MKKSISVIIPCLNEEENLGDAYENVSAALNGVVEEYEILIFDDGSTDRTGEIAEQIAARDPHVSVFHNNPNKGFGYNFIKGITVARMDYVSVMPGDNEISQESIRRIFSLVGQADIVIPFTMNMELRTYGRRLLSRLFTLVMNSLFRCELQYYNGPALHRADLVRALDIKTTGFAFQAVMLVKLIRRGHSFCEIDMYLQRKRVYKSSAIKLRNVVSVVSSVLDLWREVRRDPTLRDFENVNRVSPHAG